MSMLTCIYPMLHYFNYLSQGIFGHAGCPPPPPPHLHIVTASSLSLYALLAMAHLLLLALLQHIIPLRSLSLEGTTPWEIFLGTPPSWRSVTGSEEGVDLNSPPRVIAEGQLMHSLCALHHARMQMGISPQSLGCYPPPELLLPHQAEAYLSTPSWIPFGRGKTGGLHVKAHHNSVVLPQVSLGGSVT